MKALWQFLPWAWRHRRRVKRWVKDYQHYRQGRARAPRPAVIQLIPTERCNLRCPMCNQWGDNGYFLQGRRPVNHAPLESLLDFLRTFSRQSHGDFLLSLHGGEPMAYPHFSRLVEYASGAEIDMIVSTNGTLIKRHLPALARANRRLVYLLSLDGDEADHDRVRGPGCFTQIHQSLQALRALCDREGTGVPKLIINYCVSEHSGDVESIYPVARNLGAVALNYNFRWFMRREHGEAYERLLWDKWRCRSSGAWRGWLADSPVSRRTVSDLYALLKRRRWSIPRVTVLPRGLSRKQALDYFFDYDETFGINACLMPSYQVRIHANGELIFCPGHPDVITGNVFSQGFESVYYGSVAQAFRRHVEKQLLPVCNRCCGLYMTFEASDRLGKPFAVL